MNGTWPKVTATPPTDLPLNSGSTTRARIFKMKSQSFRRLIVSPLTKENATRQERRTVSLSILKTTESNDVSNLKAYGFIESYYQGPLSLNGSIHRSNLLIDHFTLLGPDNIDLFKSFCP
jgi:hypothetical protein